MTDLGSELQVPLNTDEVLIVMTKVKMALFMVYLNHNFQVHYDPVVSVHPVHQVREDNFPERAVPLEPIILELWMTMTMTMTMTPF